jgi:dienelactone hydrolase
MMRLRLALGLILLVAGRASADEKGTFRFTPRGDQKEVPQRYRLQTRTFDYDLTRKYDQQPLGLSVWRLRFPSPYKSPHVENNTVHAEYYRPAGKGPFPGVIVLDITGGDQSLSRFIATYLAQHGVAGLFVQMAYYGPRRPPGSNLRFLSYDIARTMNAVRQTVLDLRVAAAWMESRPELDGKCLGILGTSLGSFMSALTGEMEPRLGRVAVLLGGAGFVDGYYNHPLAAPYRKTYEVLGGNREAVKRFLAPVDPITCAANLKKHQLLILAGKRDEIVPPRMAENLWKASGRQKIIWYDCTHYGAIIYLPTALRHITDFFNAK